MQPGEVVKLLKSLESLDIRLYTHGTRADDNTTLGYQSRFERLTTLSGLSRLKVHGDWGWNLDLPQVSRY